MKSVLLGVGVVCVLKWLSFIILLGIFGPGAFWRLVAAFAFATAFGVGMLMVHRFPRDRWDDLA